MKIEFYLPRLSDDDIYLLRRFASAMVLKADAAGLTDPLHDWLFLALEQEQDRREALGSDEPQDVELLQLPNWTAAELGEAVVSANILACLPWSMTAGQLVDKLALAINVRAARVLRKTR